jgi:uncharacterized protein
MGVEVGYRKPERTLRPNCMENAKAGAYYGGMKSDEIISRLRQHEEELRAAGVTGLALFGSAARGEQGDDSDIDVVVRLSNEARSEGFAYFGRLDSLSRRLAEILKRPVDIVAEPIRKERLRQEIEKDRIVAF